MNKHEFKNSTSLKHCDYDDDNKQMEICFTSGNTYHYPNCPKAVYEALKQADSPGTHFHINIRSKYKGVAKKG